MYCLHFRIDVWLNSIREHVPNVKTDCKEELTSKFICEHHFDESAFTNSKRNRLSKFATPTIFNKNAVLLQLPEDKRLCQYSNEEDVSHMKSFAIIDPLGISADKENNVELEEGNNVLLSPCNNFQLHNDLTPKSKKIKALQRKLSSLSVKFSRAKKLSRSTSFSRKKPSMTSVMETLKSELTYCQYVFVSSQLRHTLRNPTGRRWTEEDKSFALSIYMKSPAAYRTLRKVFNLPCIKTLRKSINGIGNRPGFCPQLLDNIKNCVKKFNPLEKLCILSFDEISLKTGLQYNERFDTITGFDYNKEKLATKSLVFMIRGLTKKWKQAIGYFFLSNCTPVSVLKSFLLEAITKVTETGLKLVGMVCDQSPLNQHLYTDLKISNSFPFFQHNNNKIFAFFDAPHLLKSVRNNLKKYTIKFSEYKCAKWCYIEQLYNLDSSQRFRICPRLTKLHMETKGLSSMRVKLASQVLSHSVAAGICLLTAAGHLSSEAMYTSEFVGEMDELFDSFNSSTLQNAKEFACAVNINSKHLKMWQDKLKWIESWKFIKENNKFITPPCKKGWILSINAVIQLWEYVQNFGQKFLLTSRLNQDCLENTFSSIRRAGGFCDNPDPAKFESSIQTVMSYNLIKSSALANCIDDDDTILTSVIYNSSSDTNHFNDFSLETNNEVVDKQVFLPFNSIEKNAISYIAGYLAYKTLNKNSNCTTCKNLLTTDSVLDENSLIFQFKDYNLKHSSLKYPTNDLLESVTALANIYDINIDKYFKSENIIKQLHDTMKIVSFDWLQCDGHQESHVETIKKYLIILFVKVLLFHKIKMINTNLKNENRNKLKHVMNI